LFSTCITAQTVQTAVIIFNDWASQEITLYDDGEVLEVEWTIGPIPIDDNTGKEIILRYDTDIQSQAKYYTDANGREVLERKRDYRPTWNYTVNEPVSGNYYPINSRIWIKDQTRQFTVLTGKKDILDNLFLFSICTDRSQGGGSIHDGSVEILLHRRLIVDDKFGVDEVLNETAFGEGLVIRGKQLLIVEAPATSALVHRVSAQNMYMHPLATYSLTKQSYADYSAAYRQTWSALTDTLPLNVHLLTLDQLGPKDFLIRVEHYFELNEDEEYSHPVTIDLQSIFKSIGTISNTVELTLGGNFPLAELQRLNWVTSDNESSRVTKEQSLNDSSVRLIPMQIRTFEVTVA
jgi:lysosomal alpha-mannosidase